MEKMIFIFLLVLGIGCSKQSPKDLPAHIQNKENLTVYSINDEPDHRIHLEQERSFSDTDEVIIGKLTDIAVDNIGRVYLADGMELDIKVYAPNGDFLTRLGRQGEGPGEFRNIVDLQTTENKLFAYDPNQQRILAFSLDSLEYEYTVNIASNRGDFTDLRGAYPGSYNVSEDDTFLMAFISETVEGKKKWDWVERISLYYLLDEKGRIMTEKLFEAKYSSHVLVPVGGLSVGRPVDFFRKLLITLSDDGHVYLARSEDFLIEVYGLDGKHQRGFYYPNERVPLTDESAYAAEIPELIIEGMPSMDLPETWPALDRMRMDDEGRLWISTVVDDFDIYEWWILKKSGEVITKFEWPRDKPIEFIRNGYVYTRETDEETGLEQVVRYRIEFEEL